MTDLTHQSGVFSVDVGDAASRGSRFEHHFGVDQLPRLRALVDASVKDSTGGDSVVVSVDSKISFGPVRRPASAAVTGSVKGVFGLLCQRCLEIARIEVDHRIDTLLVKTDIDSADLEEAGLGDERWDHDGDDINMAEFVDEFLVLNLPLVVRHETIEECGPLAMQALPGQKTGAAETQTPFQGLADLLGKDPAG
ncbi:MAG: DUF177 domain-containing protein [Woeseiaceae bacterium]